MTLQEKWLSRQQQLIAGMKGPPTQGEKQEEGESTRQQEDEAAELSYKEWIEDQQRQQQVQIEAILRHQQQQWQQQLIQQLTQQQRQLFSPPLAPLTSATDPSTLFPSSSFPPPLFATIPFSSTLPPSIPHHPLPPPPPPIAFDPVLASQVSEGHQELTLGSASPPPPPPLLEDDPVFLPQPVSTHSRYYPALQDLDMLQDASSALLPTADEGMSLSSSSGSHSSPTPQYKSLHEEGSSQDVMLLAERSSSSRTSGGGRSLSCSSSGSSETGAEEEDSRFEKCSKYTRPRQREQKQQAGGVASYPSLGEFLEEQLEPVDNKTLTDISNSTSGSNGFATCSRNSTLSSIQSSTAMELVVNKAYQQQQQQPRSDSSSSTSTNNGRGSNGLPDSGSADGFVSALSRPQSSLLSSGQNLYQLQQHQLLELHQELRDEQYVGADTVRRSELNMNELVAVAQRSTVTVTALGSSSSSSFSSAGVRKGFRGSLGGGGTPPHSLGSQKRQAPAPPVQSGISTQPVSLSSVTKLEPLRSAPLPPATKGPRSEVASTSQRRRKSSSTSSAAERGGRETAVNVVISRTRGPQIPPPPVTGRISRSTERPLKTIRYPSKGVPPPRPPRPKSSPPTRRESSTKRPSFSSKTLAAPGSRQGLAPPGAGRPTPAAPPPSPSSCSSLGSRESSLESYESEDEEDRDPNASWSSGSSRASSRCSSFSCSSYESSSVSSPSIPIIDLMLALLPV